MKNSSLTEQTRRRYNRIASCYDMMEGFPEAAFSHWRHRLLAQARGRVLEVGVGTGKNFSHYPKGLHITGIDIANRMIVQARLRADRIGYPVQLMEADAQNLPFPDNSFETAVATFVFCSVPDPVQGLRELGRVVSPEGAILLLEHVRINRTVIGSLMDGLNPVVLRLMGANINRRTCENVEKAGLTISRMENLGFMGIVKMMVAHPGGT